ncbi:aminoglycoside phosphotransferase family protein [Acerihabitans sp.]|uniref:aminoglycoside phosphotransferase family protein n=1 Tax=Acerihabitans sp. TaxID=2811394 RepID=UPI002EDA78A4
MGNSFIDLSAEHQAIQEVLQNMGLLHAGNTWHATALTGGVSSNILKITVGNRQFCLKQALPTLKVAKEWHAPLERIFAEIDWMKTVARIEPHVVPKILGVDNRHLCFVMEYLPAEHYRNWKSQLLNGEIDVGFAERMGGILNNIHKQTAKNNELARMFAYDENFFSLRLDPYLGEIARHCPEHSASILSILHRTQTTKIALVHGDVSPKNILRGPQGPVILDAECAWYGDPAFDLAFCLNHFLLKSVIAKKSIDKQRLLASFQALSEKYIADIDWEPAADLNLRAATLLPCLLLARVDGKSPAEYIQGRDADRVRQASFTLLDRGYTQLKDIQEFWKKEIGL